MIRALRAIVRRRFIVCDPLAEPRGETVGLLRALLELARGQLVCPVKGER